MRFGVTLHRVQDVSGKSLQKLFRYGPDMVAADAKYRVTRLQIGNHLLRGRINGKMGMGAHNSIHGDVDIRLNSVGMILTQ